ncbi:MAG: diphthine--ammonia ligase [Candidatus Nezhaarchaeota archaeon]|nr:diphthine--ammonia ligase [Candidatus Nezhaarchaeota archaeon]
MARGAVLFTGGKDSTRATEVAFREGIEVSHLVTIVPLREDSWMYHSAALNVIDLLSEALGLPVIKQLSSGVKEEEVEDLYRALRGLDVEVVVSGVIASTYQRSRIEAVCKRLGLKPYSPLWGVDEEAHLRGLIRDRYEVVFTSVSALGLGPEWLGRRLDEEAVEELRRLKKAYGVSLALEGGEAETLVLDSPIHRRRLAIEEASREWRGRSGVLKIIKASLRDK